MMRAILILLSVTAMVRAADPLPIRREILADERKALEFEQSRGQSLRRMPRDLFEERVRRASEALAESQSPARLLTCAYRAKLIGDHLAGSADWLIRNPSDRARMLRFGLLSPAMTGSRWSDGAGAVAGELDAGTGTSGLELLVDKPGDRHFEFDWSLRSRPDPLGLRFSFQLPACPIGSFEIDLPASMQPQMVNDEASRFSAVGGAGPGERRWRGMIGGRSNLEFAVSSVAGGASKQSTVVKQSGRIDVQPGAAFIDATLQLDFGLTPQSDFELRMDSGIRPISVAGEGVKRWIEQTPDPDDGVRVSVALHRAQSSAQVHIRAVMLVPQPTTWTLPSITVVGGLPRGETSRVRVAPDLVLEDWRNAAWRVTNVKWEGDGAQVMELATSWDRNSAARPSGRFRVARTLWDVDQRTIWRIDPGRQSLNADLTITPRRMASSRCSFMIPDGWLVERVTERSAAVGMRWAVQNVDAGRRSRLNIDFDRPIDVNAPHDVAILFGNSSPLPDSCELSFPQLAPIAVRSRTAEMKVAADPSLELVALPDLGVQRLAMTQDPQTENEGKEGFLAVGSPMTGRMIVRPRGARMTASGLVKARVERSRLYWEQRLSIMPNSAPVNAVTLRCSTFDPRTNDWRVEGPIKIRQVTRLDQALHFVKAIGAAAEPIAASAALATLGADGSIWRLEFDRSTTEPFVLVLTGDEAISASGSPLNVPLWTVETAAGQKHDFTVVDPNAEAVWHADGPVEGPSSVAHTRTFRYGERPGALFVGPVRAPSHLPETEQHRLIVGFSGDGRLVCQSSMVVRSWDRSTMRLEMPPLAEWVSAEADGDTVPATTSEDSVDLIWPQSPVEVNLIVTYLLPAPSRFPLARLEVNWPRLPIALDSPDVTWKLPAELEACVYQKPAIQSVSFSKHQPLTVGVRDTASEVQTTGPALWVARPPGVLALSIALATALIGVFLVLGRRWRGRLAIILAVSGGLAIIALPGPMQPLGWSIAIASVLAIAARRIWKASPTAAAAAITLVAYCNGPASGPPTATVYLVAGSSGEYDIALVPTDLLERLDAMALTGQPMSGAAILSADYVGSIEGMRVAFAATYRIVALKNNVDWLLPVFEVPIEAVSVDGAPGMPKAVGGRNQISLDRRGEHSIVVRFQTPIVERSADRFMQFRIEPAPICKCSVRLPDGAMLSKPPSGTGMFTVADRMLSADLGDVRTIEINWKSKAKSVSPTGRNVRDAYRWELAAPVARLTAVVRCTLGAGLNHELTMAIPRELDLFTIRSDDSTQLAGWHVSANRELTVTWNPASVGMARLVMELLPRDFVVPGQPLPFPSVDESTATLFAWNSSDSSAIGGRTSGVTSIPAEDFRREFGGPTTTTGDDATTLHAFRRLGGAMPPSIRVAANPPRWKGNQSLHWRIGANRADLSSQVEMTTSGPPLYSMEWDVPASTIVTELKGIGVAGWTRAGTKLQIWFEAAQTTASLRWHGSVNLPQNAGRFDLPNIRLNNAEAPAQLTVEGAIGWDIQPILAQNLAPLPGGVTGRIWKYRADRPSYRAAFELTPAGASTVFHIANRVSATDVSFTNQVTIDAHNRRGGLRSFVIQARANALDNVVIDAGGAIVSERPASPGRRAWLIDPVDGDSLRLNINASANRGQTKSWQLPTVEIEMADGLAANVDQSVITVGVAAGNAFGLESNGERHRPSRRDWRMTVEVVDSPPKK